LGIINTAVGLLYNPCLSNKLLNFDAVEMQTINHEDSYVGFHHIIERNETGILYTRDYDNNITQINLIDSDGEVVSEKSYDSWLGYSDSLGLTIWISDVETPYLYKKFQCKLFDSKSARN
jgi:hypothetical protein